MASLGSTFDASQVEPTGDRSTLPAGDYIAAIVKSEKKDTKSGGALINLEYEVMDGPAKGRRFWNMLNLWNSSAQAVENAQRELSAICHAVGKLKVSDTSELHAIPMLVRLRVETSAQYGEQNRVVSHKPANGAPAATAAPAARAAGGAKAGPWA